MRRPLKGGALLLLLSIPIAGYCEPGKGYEVRSQSAQPHRVRLETDAFIIVKHLGTDHRPADLPANAAIDFTTIVPPVFEKKVKTAAELPAQSLANRSEYAALERIDKDGTDDDYAAALAQYSDMANTDPLKGYAPYHNINWFFIVNSLYPNDYDTHVFTVRLFYDIQQNIYVDWQTIKQKHLGLFPSSLAVEYSVEVTREPNNSVTVSASNYNFQRGGYLQ